MYETIITDYRAQVYELYFLPSEIILRRYIKYTLLSLLNIGAVYMNCTLLSLLIIGPRYIKYTPLSFLIIVPRYLKLNDIIITY